MSYTNLNYHIVFSTKGRRALLQADVLPRLVKYIGGIARKLDGKLLEANRPDDHLHMATIVYPQKPIADFARDIKANSSKWIHKTFSQLKDFAWQDGYSAFAVSHSAIPKVIEYIRNQQEHHRKMTFQEELIALLKRHEIDFDERYIFE
jgi:REP element-mobilizing transposase RayT